MTCVPLGQERKIVRHLSHYIVAFALASLWAPLARILPMAGLITTVAFYVPPAFPQTPKLEQCLAEISRAEAMSKQALAQYSWQEEERINIKGELKERKVYHVQMGRNGQISRSEVALQGSPEPSTYAPIRRIFGKTSAEYRTYANQIDTLAESYVFPDSSTLLDLLQLRRVLLGSVGFRGEVQLVVQGYFKQGDSLTIFFSRTRQAIVSVEVSSYLSDPQDQVTISAQFEQLSNGPNHISTLLVNRVSKQMTVSLRNSGYQKNVDPE